MGPSSQEEKNTSIPCRCAPRWVPGPAEFCPMGFWWMGRKVPLNLHQESTELPSTCSEVLGYTCRSLCIWLGVRRFSVRKVRVQLSPWGREGSALCWQRQNTVQGLYHLFSLCHAIPFFHTANDAGESACSLLHPLSVLQWMRHVTLKEAYATLKSKAVSQGRWIIKAF